MTDDPTGMAPPTLDDVGGVNGTPDAITPRAIRNAAAARVYAALAAQVDDSIRRQDLTGGEAPRPWPECVDRCATPRCSADCSTSRRFPGRRTGTGSQPLQVWLAKSLKRLVGRSRASQSLRDTR